MAIELNPKYEPLLTGRTRYTIIAGGRGSGKSFAVSTALLLLSDQDDGTILFTRYTMVNAEVSIMPEFMEKIDLLGWGSRFHKSGNDLINLRSGGKILFRGIKTSNGINTAALKSIPNLKMWVNDESEELVDENVFNTIDLSIRKKGAACRVWLALNPSDINHFIYRRFFKANGVPDVCNRRKGDVTYIHTTYQDNAANLGRDYVAKAEKWRAEDEQKYNNIWLGHWAELSEGLIYRNWEKITGRDYPANLPTWYGIDWGFANDPLAIVRVAYDFDTSTIYIKELGYEIGRLTSWAAEVIAKDIKNRRAILYEEETWRVEHYAGAVWIYEKKQEPRTMSDEEFMQLAREQANTPKGPGMSIAADRLQEIMGRYDFVYCDPARPEQIAELRTVHGISAVPGTNTDKVGRIEYLKYFKVKYIGANIEREKTGYKWMQDKKDRAKFINQPQDGNDHLMDAINYAAVTHLRRLGVANNLGEE